MTRQLFDFINAVTLIKASAFVRSKRKFMNEQEILAKLSVQKSLLKNAEELSKGRGNQQIKNTAKLAVEKAMKEIEELEMLLKGQKESQISGSSAAQERTTSTDTLENDALEQSELPVDGREFHIGQSTKGTFSTLTPRDATIRYPNTRITYILIMLNHKAIQKAPIKTLGSATG